MIRCRFLFLSSLSQSRNFPRLGIQWSPPIRFVQGTSRHLDVNEYTQALYSKLSAKTQYQFLDRDVGYLDRVEDVNLSSSVEFNDFLRILASADSREGGCEELEKISEIQQVFSEKFREWTKVSQLRVGFLMYMDRRISSDQYLDKVIRHMGSGDLFKANPHDLVALLLLIYFKRNLSVEDVSEFMDTSLLQTAISVHIKEGKLTRDEICAVCLGLKRIENLKVNYKPLRSELYQQLKSFQSSGDSKLDDFFIISLLTTLSKEHMVYFDDRSTVQEMLASIALQVKNLGLDTAIRLLSYPLTLGLDNKVIEEEVVDKIKTSLAELNTRDLLSLCNYFSKQTESNVLMMDSLAEHLEKSLDDIKTLEELTDIIDCFHYLSHKSVYSERCNELLFEALRSVETSDLPLNIEKIGQSVAMLMLSKLIGEESSLQQVEDYFDQKQGTRLGSMYTRIPSFLYSSYEVDSGEKLNKVNKIFLQNLQRSFHRRLPLELYAPQLDTKKLEFRSKQLVNIYRMMVKFMGNERHVKVTRILPHFDQPDIVFGNIGGVSLSVPHYLEDAEFVGVRRPPPGDWWVLMISLKKHLDVRNNVVGQEALKMAQLKRLGYTPVVLPLSDYGSPSQLMKVLSEVLKTSDVSVPNLDDGIHAKYRKY